MHREFHGFTLHSGDLQNNAPINVMPAGGGGDGKGETGHGVGI